MFESGNEEKKNFEMDKIAQLKLFDTVLIQVLRVSSGFCQNVQTVNSR